MTPYILQVLTRFGLAPSIAKIRDRHGLITGAISNGAFYEIERTRVHPFSDGCSRLFNGNRTASGRNCGVPGNRLVLKRLDAACRSNRDVINSARHKLCATMALPPHFRDSRSKELMKTHAVLAAVLLMLGPAPARATVRIANDTGGQIGPYLAKYRALRASGERVEIDGPARRHVLCCWVSFRETVSASRRAPASYFTAPGTWKAIKRSPPRATASCGRLIPKACAGGSNRTADCILKLSR